MSEIKLGLQNFSVREAFSEDPIATIKKIKAMGYTGVEVTMGSVLALKDKNKEYTLEFFKDALAKEGLECYGVLTSWENVQPDKIEEALKFNKEISSPFLVIGSVPSSYIKTMEDVNNIVSYMNRLIEITSAEGVITGYHNHDTDFTTVIDGKTFFEHVFDNTPQEFAMLLDTGNAKAAGFDAIELLKKYPGRSPFLHIKGYSEKEGYLAYIGQDDYNWEELIKCALEVGKTKVFDIEFGQRGAYDPFERAENSYNVVKPLLDKLLAE